MKKADQPMQLASSISVPVTQCVSEESVVVPWWWLPPPDLIKSISGPLYKVITIAPETVITVPITLARLCNFFTFTVSNLINYKIIIILNIIKLIQENIN